MFYVIIIIKIKSLKGKECNQVLLIRLHFLRSIYTIISSILSWSNYKLCSTWQLEYN